MDRIGFCGTRGIPASYGGFETAVDEISLRFIEQGYEVDVFCRDSVTNATVIDQHGRRLIYVKGSRIRSLDTFISSIQTGLYLIKNRRHYRHVFWFNNANLPGIIMTTIAGIKLTLNTDGLEWKRKKWSPPFQLYYFISSFILSIACTRLISDSIGIQDYYKRKFNKRTHFIPYGIPSHIQVDQERQIDILQDYRLEPKKYFLQITRFEPDNLPLEVLRGFSITEVSKLGYKLVLVGYKDATSYSTLIRELAIEGKILVLPAIYDPATLFSLRTNCYCYIHGNSVGGTNPALLEAMATAPRVLAIESPFSREVLGDLGQYFAPTEIPEAIDRTLNSSEQSSLLSLRVQSLYQWPAVAQSYIELLESGGTSYRGHLSTNNKDPFTATTET